MTLKRALTLNALLAYTFLTFGFVGRTNLFPEWLDTRSTAPYADFCTPADSIRGELIKLIRHEKKSIKLAMYYFSDSKIISELALRGQEENGPHITVVIDPRMPRTNIAKLLPYAKIYEYPFEPGLMHHKYIIFEENYDGRHVVGSGSYNFTPTAHGKNQENFSFYACWCETDLFGPKYCHFRKHFQRLKQDSVRWNPLPPLKHWLY